MLELKEKIKSENQNASKKLACSVENQINDMDFFKTSFWGIPIPMGKVNRILALKTQASVNPDDQKV